ncbi:class II poly(R)-hydroxyalkanoic acid synthase [Maricurvus nonylphenolicus]|uniref:PHA/PHB synthase family protein n=1 Tax=Maricurvus nonylphenolicus TaxID=1008307 RepID=UPI0036F3A8F0
MNHASVLSGTGHNGQAIRPEHFTPPDHYPDPDDISSSDTASLDHPSSDSEDAEQEESLSNTLQRLRERSASLKNLASQLQSKYDSAEHDTQPDQPSKQKQENRQDPFAESPYEADDLDSEIHSTLKGRSLLDAAGHFLTKAIKQPDVFARHYGTFAKETLRIVKGNSTLEPERGDKRFRDAVWKDNMIYHTVLQTYLAADKGINNWVEELDMDEADRRRSRFLYQQISALFSPTNSLLNPVAVKRIFQTGGKSLIAGLKNMADDIQHNHGMPSQVRPDAFTVGKDLAYTPGAVVYRNEILELIQYQMQDGQTISQRPVLIVPPQLNKFYVFDLTPKNSLVNYLQSQGIQPFVISWRNPNKSHADWNLDDYVTALEHALEAMCEITGADKVNLASACAGGLTSMALLGYLTAIDKPLVHSHSLFVTALQADDNSALGLFATREAVELSRRHAKTRGYMDGKELSHIFAWLRPTDLVWNYWINNYLLGKEPPSMDVLYWDNDSTRLPAGLHSDFLDIFVEDMFSQPGKLIVKGQPIDIQQITMDFYCVGGDEDYLMPWKNCFDLPHSLSNHSTFVLSTSGHIQSILRPPGIANTAYYTNPDVKLDADDWLESAQKNKGSWWEHWGEWLNDRGGETTSASETLGSEQHPPLCASPGQYVNE